ncbi:MAG: hypothetical protein PHP85_08110 [Gallionella sp.]|nr:hypothetical protein [Gallionella sp.]
MSAPVKTTVCVERHHQLMAKYYVPDLGGNSTSDSPLAFILDRLDTNNALPSEDKQYLRDKGLFDLHHFVKELEAHGKPDFSVLRSKFEHERKLSIRNNLRSKYGLEYDEHGHMDKLIHIIARIEQGIRFTDADVVWLTDRNYFTPCLKHEFHRLEAIFCSQNFASNGNPWEAVNASSHFRKANMPSDGLNIATRVDMVQHKDKHLKSAICTTMGGSKRDLGKFDEALICAHDAHAHDPKSFHPCTLFGALHYQLGNYSLGDEWFQKAVERGAKSGSIDAELRSIFRQAEKNKKEELRHHLLKIDPVRYSWVNRTQNTPTRVGQKP